MHKYYSNGKLLITGEYAVLDGALALALPTLYGQSLNVKPIDEHVLIWESYHCDKSLWLRVEMEIPNLNFISSSFKSTQQDYRLAITLKEILKMAMKLNSSFLNYHKGYLVKTYLNFPHKWGLGTSSTLISNIAKWANVDPYKLLELTFHGSGYDIACAQNNQPLLYKTSFGIPDIKLVSFNPDFKDNIHFVYLNHKQNTSKEINIYKKYAKDFDKKDFISNISLLTLKALHSKDMQKFSKVLKEHELIVADYLCKKTVHQELFPDFGGVVKSLGAWGGDFILALSQYPVENYFKSKGYNTIIPYSSMIRNNQIKT